MRCRHSWGWCRVSAAQAVERLGRISKQGNRQLRTLLIHGVRSVVRAAAKKDDAFSLWVRQLVIRRGYNKAAVAVANKTTCVAWWCCHNRLTTAPVGSKQPNASTGGKNNKRHRGCR